MCVDCVCVCVCACVCVCVCVCVLITHPQLHLSAQEFVQSGTSGSDL